MNGGVEADEEMVRRAGLVMGKVLRIPERYRSFRTDAEQAKRVHKISRPVLNLLLDLGLPNFRVDGVRRFDSLDLQNIGIDLRLPCLRWVGMRAWSRMFANASADQVHSIQIRAKCPSPGHDGACSYEPAGPDLSGLAGEVGWVGEQGLVTVDVPTSTSEIRFGTPFAPVDEAAGRLTFYLIPNALQADLGFLHDSGLADCRLASRWLVEFAAEQGIPLRSTSGVFVARPFPVRHSWVEYRHDDHWLAADPFLLHAFARWEIVDPLAWPADRSLEGFFWSLRGSGPFFLHKGVAAPDSMIIRSSVIRPKGVSAD